MFFLKTYKLLFIDLVEKGEIKTVSSLKIERCPVIVCIETKQEKDLVVLPGQITNPKSR
jgi:hypothetical protein